MGNELFHLNKMTLHIPEHTDLDHVPPQEQMEAHDLQEEAQDRSTYETSDKSPTLLTRL